MNIKNKDIIAMLSALDPDGETQIIEEPEPVSEFDHEQELRLLILEKERALEDVMSLLQDYSDNKANNNLDEMKTLEPMVRSQIQQVQITIRTSIYDSKRFLSDLITRKQQAEVGRSGAIVFTLTRQR